VNAARLSADQRTVELQIDHLQPTWCMSIECQLLDQAGNAFSRTVHHTIHRLKTHEPER
jgi:hypothetical protein